MAVRGAASPRARGGGARGLGAVERVPVIAIRGRAEAATVAATAALELERRRASVLADEKRVLIAEVKRLRGAADAAAQDAAAARADRQRLKNERRALARELQATRTALAAASSPKPAPPRAPPPRPRASSSEDPEDAVVLEMLGIC